MKRILVVVLLVTSPILAWEFDIDGNTEGWKGMQADIFAQDGVLRATVAGNTLGNDPRIESPFGPYYANEIRGLYLKARWSIPDTSQFGSSRFYWFPTSGGHNSVAYAASSDPNRFSVVYIDLLTREVLENDNYWEGMINKFRIGLLDGLNVDQDYSVDFDWIRLEGLYLDNESFEYWDHDNDKILGWNVPADVNNFDFGEQATVHTRNYALKVTGKGDYQRITQDIKGGLDMERGARVNLTGALNVPTASWAAGSVIWFCIREVTHDGQENLSTPITVTTWDDWFEFNSELILIHEPADRAAVDIQLISSTPAGTVFYVDDIFVYVNFVDVPNVIGMTQADAEAVLAAADLTVGAVGAANSHTAPSGEVISQDPEAGTNITSGSAVDMVVSLGPVLLECEIEGYPCSLAEVPIEILERSDALGNEVLVRFERGDSTSEISTWLNAQEDMAEVQADDLAVRFRLDGGRGTWILRKEAFATRIAPGAPSFRNDGGNENWNRHQTFAARSAPDVASSSDRPVLQSAIVPLHVVGKEIKQKEALVLSPMLWDFCESDDGALVAEILASTRGYENGVKYLFNDSPTSTVVGVDSFKNWGNYQVIHVVSHGTRLCNPGPCRAVILASTLQGALPEGSGIISIENIQRLTDRGLVLVKAQGTGKEDNACGAKGTSYNAVALEADFFKDQYGEGLDDSLIFFNACETFGSEATDLADAVRGNTSVFLGWDNNVISFYAATAALALYEELSKQGYTVETAYTQLGALQFDMDGAQLRRSKRQAGGDLRIREVVYLLNPASEQILSASDEVSIDGIKGDDEPDVVPYLVKVDGIGKESASNVLLHVSIDGVEAEPQPVSSGEGNDQDQWLVSGVVSLPYDLEEETEVTFRAWVELPSGGESDHEIRATLTGEEGPIMGQVWEMEVTTVTGHRSSGTSQTKIALLTLEFAEGQDTNEPYPKYVVTGGTVTYKAQSYVDAYLCARSSPEVTFELIGDMIPDTTSDIFWYLRLKFDTTVDPVEYWGHIQTYGPDLVVQRSCPQGDYTTDYGGTSSWLSVDRDKHKTVTDRRMITGSYQSGSDGFHNQTWTITRIK
jgi:hypothetical protein